MTCFLKNKDTIDSFQAFLVEGAKFTDIEEYPIIEKEMVSKTIPFKVMPFFKAITYRGDLSETFIYFYSPDKTFERVRRNPQKYLNFFKRCGGIIGFDFSVHTDMPIIKQKSQLNDNLALTFYYGKKGVPIIPNCRGGSEIINNEYFNALPKKTYVALGVHGFIKLKHQKQEWIWRIGTLIKKLEPKGIIVLGHLPVKIIDIFKNDVDFYFFDTIIDERNKEVKKNVN